MKPLKLHVKVTLLTIGITVVVLASTIAIITAQVTSIVVREQRERAELSALSLANETSRQEGPMDPDRARREAAIVRNARSSFTAVRIYELEDDNLVETAHADGSEPAQPISLSNIRSIKRGEIVREDLSAHSTGNANRKFRVFAPIMVPGQNDADGVVEVVVTLQPAIATAEQFSRYLLWLIGAAIAITSLCSYLMMSRLVYLPIKKLLYAMQQAESGNLDLEVEPRAPDELGVLSRGFNRMIVRLRAMTEERERQRKYLAKEVNKATQELWTLTRHLSSMERLAAAGQTAAQFAHEVGTPLHIINGHVQLLKNRVGKDIKASERLGIITDQIKRIETIVRAMLDRTRLPKPHRESLSPTAILEAICEATAPTIEASGVRLERLFEPDIPTITGDPERLQQAFLNLINNALDATAAGGTLKIATRHEKNRNEVIFEFADTGIGMPDEVAARIFDPLYTTKERGSGTGLGLVIVQQVAREHGGRVDFDTIPGQGTTFRIYLPVLAVQEFVETVKVVER
jgi:two-component system, NtrC family, sensor kinase